MPPTNQGPPSPEYFSSSDEDVEVEYDDFNIQKTKDDVARAHQRPAAAAAAASTQGRHPRRTKQRVSHHAKRKKTRAQEKKEYEKKKPKPTQNIATSGPRSGRPPATTVTGSQDFLGFTVNTEAYTGKP